MNKIQFLTMVGCHNCEAVKKIFDEIMPEFKDKVEVVEIDIASPEGQELAGKYGVMASPGIVINDELFSTGGVDKDKLIERLRGIDKNLNKNVSEKDCCSSEKQRNKEDSACCGISSNEKEKPSCCGGK